jgi:hypothetical protein
MKRIAKALTILLAVAGVTGAVLVLMAADNAKPYLPGITVTDDHPRTA